MTKIVVVGDSHVGKTTFAHVACKIAIPLNVFRSTVTEVYYWHGNDSTAELHVVPGFTDAGMLKESCLSAEGIVVLYDCRESIHAAKKWLRQIAGVCAGVHEVPIMVCQHKYNQRNAKKHERRLSEFLLHYEKAEHTHTTITNPVGIQDCVNRIIKHVRRNLPSPLCEHGDAKE